MADVFKNYLTQLGKVAKILKLPSSVVKKLATPESVHQFTFPVKLDNGKIKNFTGFRIQFNSALGPYKGGIRFHPNVSLSEVEALGAWMAVKCAVADLPLGGGKGGVIVDPKTLSEGELERLSRGYIRKIAPFIGQDKDVPAPDVNTNPKIMAWMVDEYEKMKGQKEPAVITGKPLSLGGSKGRTEATGRGGVFILKELSKKLGFKPEKTTVAIQGFGNVGFYFAKFASQLGFKITAVSDSKGSAHVPHGLSPEKTMECKREKGQVSGCYCQGSVCDLTLGRPMSNENLLELPVDILVPAALEGAINKDNAHKIKAKVIIEMANGPITTEADKILEKRKTVVVPDVLANSGGVTVSYFEWVQGRQGYFWEEEEVNKALEKKMKEAFLQVWNEAEKRKVSLRDAAYIVAFSKIIEAMKLRGWI